MTNSIKWHKNCLRNCRTSSNSLRKHLKKEYDKLCKLERMNKFYEIQIKEAEKQRKSTFDADKFLKSKRKKYE